MMLARLIIVIGVLSAVVIQAAIIIGRFLPEPEQIAFMYQGTDIYHMDIKRGLAYPLLHTVADERFPEFSPDGTQLAYHSNRRGTFNLYTFDMQQHTSQILSFSLESLYDEAMIEWSPDGEYISFHSDAIPARGFDIYISQPDGRFAKNIIKGNGHSAAMNWSPDGQWVVFSANRDAVENLYILNIAAGFQVTGRNERNKQHIADYAFYSDWSPDSKQIVYVSNMTGSDDLYIVDINGENRRNITNTIHADETHPVWLADGRIMFSSNQDGDWDIYIMDVDKNHIQRITNLHGDEEAATWR